MKRTFLWLLLLPVFAIGCAAPATSPAESPLTFDTGINPEGWALVPAGEFLRGLHDLETVVDYDYEIMITTVTNAQYANYLNEALAAGAIKIVDDQVVGYYPGDEFHGYRHEEEIAADDWPHISLDDPGLRLRYDGKTFSAMNGYENRPMVQVTWFGARSYCEFTGGRLPTEVEWEKAARGTDGRPFPWGHEIQPENANYYSSHDIFEKIVGKLGDTTPVGFYNGNTYDGFQTIDSPSPYGLYDMGGNVWQWTGDIYEGAHYRYMRGGSKADYGYNLRVWTRNNSHPDYVSPNVGFRCVRLPGD
ncbi:MAG: formylglycine-generating enzyme family protein [Anaerolineaceae bacterium]|nr:MAG: formylglycine-generating enzyme family protein [Anaerolineaceae bacterium]